MPVKLGSDSQGCYAKWGEMGHKYYYKCGNPVARNAAKKKAIKQGIAIGEFAGERISFDYDDTLNIPSVIKALKAYQGRGIPVYIISARSNPSSMYAKTDELKIPRSRVFATGSNNLKIEKIKELEITKHYDNNPNVIDKLGSIGKLVKLSALEIFTNAIKFLKS